MSFSALYQYCQTLDVPIGRKALHDKVCELTRRPGPIKPMISSIDDTVLGGFIVWPGDVRHPYAKYCTREPVVVLARGLTQIEQRFVFIKELMHLFDDGLELVSTPEEFEALLSDMTVPPADTPSHAVRSEADCIWMALAVLCPEKVRQDYQRRREAGKIGDSQISRELKVPEIYVPSLFVSSFKQTVTYLLEGG